MGYRVWACWYWCSVANSFPGASLIARFVPALGLMSACAHHPPSTSAVEPAAASVYTGCLGALEVVQYAGAMPYFLGGSAKLTVDGASARLDLVNVIVGGPPARRDSFHLAGTFDPVAGFVPEPGCSAGAGWCDPWLPDPSADVTDGGLFLQNGSSILVVRPGSADPTADCEAEVPEVLGGPASNPIY